MKKMKPFTVKFVVVGEVLGTIKYFDIRTGKERHRWWTKARIPGTVRPSRMPGGSGFRNNWQEVA